MAIRRELHHLLDEVLADDPRRALIAVRRLGDHLPWLEARAVAKAREHGWSWPPIGRLLDRSRQSVRERYRGLVPSAPPGTGAPDPDRDWQHLHDGLRRLREFEGDDAIGW